MEHQGSLYCVVPEHLSGRLDDIRRYVETHGRYFSDGRDFSVSHSSPEISDPRNISEIQSADAVLVFGVSERALNEAHAARRFGRSISLHFLFEDPGWRDRYHRIGENYGRPLDGARCYSFLPREEAAPRIEKETSETAQASE